MQEMREIHSKEIKSLERQLEVTKQELSEENNRLSEEKERLEKEQAETSDKYERELARLKDAIDKSDKAVAELRKDVQGLESEREELLRSTQEKTTNVQHEFETLVKRLKEQAQGEKEALRMSQDEELKKMAAFYSGEKEKGEQRVQEERDKAESRTAKLRTEYEERLRGEQTGHDEDLEALRTELANVKISNQSHVQNLATENAKRAEQNDMLASQLRQVTEDYEALKKAFAAKVDAVREAHEAEQGELIRAADLLKQQLAEREARLWEQSQALQQSHSELQKLQELNVIQLQSQERETARLKQELADARGRAEGNGNALVEQKIDFGKQIALANQQNSFMAHRIDELLKQQDYLSKRLDEKLALQREAHEKERQSLEAKFQEQMQGL